MTRAVARRALFDRFRGGPVSLRPPWVIGEASFSERCDGCGDCIGACPSGLLIAGRGRLPVVDFAKSQHVISPMLFGDGVEWQNWGKGVLAPDPSGASGGVSRCRR